MKNTLLPLLLAAAPVSALSAQTATCLLVEDGPLVGGPLGETVDSLSNTAVNQQGGFAVSTNTTDGITTSSRMWGTASGGTGAPLQTEGTIGDYAQTGFESFFGLAADGTIAYSATVTNTVTLETSLDSAWLGDTPLAIQGEPIPSLPTKVWRFASRVGVTDDGQPWWVSGINSDTGANEGAGWFFGTDAAVVYQTGDVIAGLPAPLDTSPVDFDSRFSALGGHHIAVLDTTAALSADQFVMIDGAPLEVGGGPVGEGQACLAAGALPGESWLIFDSLGITEAGDWFFSGNTNAAAANNEILCKNGAIVYREGDTVDGVTLTGAMESAFMTENGDIAYVWDYDSGGTDLEALFVDDRLVLSEGDAVDLDGDGVVDPGAKIADFTGITSMTISADRVLYVTADIDTLGTASSLDDTECLLAITDPGAGDFIATPPQIFLDQGGTQNLFVRAPAGFAGDLYGVLGSTSGTAPGFPLGGVALPLNLDTYFLITLTKANSGPLVDTFGSLDANGDATARFTLGVTTAPAYVGLTLNHAYIVIDAVGFFVEYASSPTGLLLTL